MARAGVEKIIFVNSHGVSEEIMGIVARELRVRPGTLAVKSGWRFTRRISWPTSNADTPFIAATQKRR